MYLLLCIGIIVSASAGIHGTQLEGSFYREFLMPGVSPKSKDAYVCTSMKLNATEEWIIRYEPLASANRAHHMLLYGCEAVRSINTQGYWDCGHHGICDGSRILYAWAKNAPSTNLPDDVGFRIGKSSGVSYLVLQIHYANPIAAGIEDHSGLKMLTTETKQRYKAGIYLLAKGFLIIPPHLEKVHGDLNCDVNLSANINLFAYRVHAHALGAVISGYRYDKKADELTLIAKGNPQWPQSFYPTDKIYAIKPHDIIHARCTFNSTNRGRQTFIGATSNDEMCNLYLMYYTERENGPDAGYCGVEQFPQLTKALPLDSDQALPENDKLRQQSFGENTNKDKEISYENLFKSGATEFEEQPKTFERTRIPIKPKPVKLDSPPLNIQSNSESSKINDSFISRLLEKLSTYHFQTNVTPFFVVRDWGPNDYKLGQVTAVSIDSHGDVVVFHRGNRVWDATSFDGLYLKDQSNPILTPTVLHLSHDNGTIMHEWGANYFHMPHGLTVDAHDNVWLTDVGMHQVFKFPPGFTKDGPKITLGTRFLPGRGNNTFCKPTAVAVMENGQFFVSDGYCNSRIVHYSAEGAFLTEINADEYSRSEHSFGSMTIPHALTLTRADKDICTADRENGRVLCFNTDDYSLSHEFHRKDWGPRIFSTTYSKADDKLYAINGPHYSVGKVSAFQLNFSSSTLEGKFSPDNEGFSNPHDMAVSSDGIDIYVVEIGPNKIWKFSKELFPVNGSGGLTPHQVIQHIQEAASPVLQSIHKAAVNGLNLYDKGWSKASILYIIIAMVAIPIVVLSCMAVCTRYRRDSPVKHPFGNSGKSSLKLLIQKNGFKRVRTNDSLSDSDSTDSEIEDFSLNVAKV